MTISKDREPLLIIYLTPKGVLKTLVPYRNLAEEKAGRDLEAKCATMISLLSQVARGTAQEIAPLAPEPSLDNLLHSNH